MEQRPVSVRGFGEQSHGLQSAEFVVGGHYADQHDVFRHSAVKRRRRHRPVLSDGQIFGGETETPKLFAALVNGGVFHGGRDDAPLAARERRALHRPVVRLRAPRREINFVRGRTYAFRNASACGSQRRRGVASVRVTGIGIAEHVRKIRPHRFHRLVAERRGGGIVEIYAVHILRLHSERHPTCRAKIRKRKRGALRSASFTFSSVRRPL